MKVLVTGEYQPAYNRNRIILKGLIKHSIELIQFPYEKRDPKTLKKVIELSEECDLLFLPSFTHLDVPFLKRKISKPIVFDPLISKYMTKVFDLKTVWKYSPRAYKNFLKDKIAFKYSDLILADTKSHKEYFCNKFGVDPNKIIVVPVGVDTDDFFPLKISEEKKDKVIVGFYGTFIPLHGIEKIIMSAFELKDRKDIVFEIYGKGFLFNKISPLANKLGLQNIEFKGWVPYGELNNVINSMDICLGIFGESIKTEIVVPNKIFHYAACGKPIITFDTKGIREIFTDNKDIVLSTNDPVSIAEKIAYLVDNPKIREEIGKTGYNLISSKYDKMNICEPLIKGFLQLLKN